jgi:hypothetical protein
MNVAAASDAARAMKRTAIITGEIRNLNAFMKSVLYKSIYFRKSPQFYMPSIMCIKKTRMADWSLSSGRLFNAFPHH